MANNYREIGQSYRDDFLGVKLVEDFVSSLEKEGLLPPNFPSQEEGTDIAITTVESSFKPKIFVDQEAKRNTTIQLPISLKKEVNEMLYRTQAQIGSKLPFQRVVSALIINALALNTDELEQAYTGYKKAHHKSSLTSGTIQLPTSVDKTLNMLVGKIGSTLQENQPSRQSAIAAMLHAALSYNTENFLEVLEKYQQMTLEELNSRLHSPQS